MRLAYYGESVTEEMAPRSGVAFADMVLHHAPEPAAMLADVWLGLSEAGPAGYGYESPGRR